VKLTVDGVGCEKSVDARNIKAPTEIAIAAPKTKSAESVAFQDIVRLGSGAWKK
jgi:hypothetical protein